MTAVLSKRGGGLPMRSVRLWRCRMTAERPVQLGLLEGADKAVGPMLTSVVHGSNADLITAVAPLYLHGSVLDVTYGRGMWWRRYRPTDLVTHDLAIDGVDFRALPHPDSSFDTVCFDPPYIPQGGTSAQDVKSRRFRASFGLETSLTQRDLDAMVTAGLEECARVARQFLLVKCMDYVNGKQLHLGHVRVLTEAQRFGLTVHDLLILSPGHPGPGGAQIRVVHRARRAHSYLLVLTPTGRRVSCALDTATSNFTVQHASTLTDTTSTAEEACTS